MPIKDYNFANLDPSISQVFADPSYVTVMSGLDLQKKYGRLGNRMRGFKVLIQIVSNMTDTKIIDKAIAKLKPEYQYYAGLSVKITDHVEIKECNSVPAEFIVVEMTIESEEKAFGRWYWEFRSTPQMESTTVDYLNRPIVVSLPSSVEWFAAETSMVMLYTQFQDQVAEMQRYVAGGEIIGQRVSQVRDTNNYADYQISTLPYQGTLNDSIFFGWAKGNVLCMGIDVAVVGSAAGNRLILEETVRFLCRPGIKRGAEVLPSRLYPNGWDTYAYWSDPVTGKMPKNLKPELMQPEIDPSVPAAVRRVQHYPYANFDWFIKNQSRSKLK